MQQTTVVANMRAGAGHDAVDRIEQAFASAGCAVEVRPVAGPMLSVTAAEAIEAGSQVIVAAGGDGTVSAVAAAVAGTGATLGVLPLGTLNHFAKDLGLPIDLNKAAEIIAAGRTRSVDIAELNGRCFINTASIGVYSRLLAERAARERGGRTKWIAHAAATARAMSTYRPVHALVQDNTRSDRVVTPFVFVGNNEYELSGWELGGRQRLTDGRLHVCMAPGMSRGGVARLVVAAAFGRIHMIEDFESFLTSRVDVDVTMSRVHVSLDGEVIPFEAPLRFQSRPAGLRVIAPVESR